MKNYPELNDMIQDMYFESSVKFSAIKEFCEKLNDISKDSGMDLVTLQGVISGAIDKINYLESEEFADTQNDKTLHQIECMAKDIELLK